MKPTERQAQIIRKLGLQGTLIEQLVMKPGVLTNPERYVDSPSLMRFAMDVHGALGREGLKFQRVGKEYNLRQTKT